MPLDLVFSGHTTPGAQIISLINQIHAAGGGSLTITGTHVLEKPVFAAISFLTLDFGATGKLILGEGIASPAVTLMPPVPLTGTLTIQSPRIDCSRGKYVSGSSSATALNPLNYSVLRIFDVDLYGGNWRKDARSDSGIAPGNCRYGRIEGGTIEGFHDLGIYVTGGLEEIDGPQHMEIKDVKIINCRHGIDSKRAFKLLTIKDVNFVDCEVAIKTSWVGTGPNSTITLPPGKKVNVIRGVIRRPKIAFSPEGPSTMRIEDTEVIKPDTLAKNEGAKLVGKCFVRGDNDVVTQMKLDLSKTEGVEETFKPITRLKTKPL